MIVVAQDGTGNFTTIQAALDSIAEDNKEKVLIEIKAGTYKEKLMITKPSITLVGEDKEKTIITYDDGATKTFENGEKYGTFRSYSVFVGANDFSAHHITFENAAGSGEVAGQALALYVDADRVHFKECRFLGHQDTLFTGPLPQAPIEPNSFRGPREHAPRINGRHYYEACYIEGDVDFIFGSATALFEQCEIFSKNRDQEINGYITAASTPKGQTYGYIFKDCKLTSDCMPKTVYLGRPWREYAHVAFVNCEMGAHIKKEGWHNWSKERAESTARFEEYCNTGAGACLEERIQWAKVLTKEEADHYSKDKVLGGWCPK